MIETLLIKWIKCVGIPPFVPFPLQTRAVSLLESTTNTFVEETVGNQEVDILEQVGKGLLHGMSNVLDVSAVSPASGSKTFRTLNKEVEQGEGVEPLSFEVCFTVSCR